MTQWLLMLTVLGLATAAPEFDKYTLIFEEGVSQTSIGTYFHPLATDETQAQYAAWVMDFQNERLRFDIGHPNETLYTRLYCFKHRCYVMDEFTGEDCVRIDFVTFEAVLRAYMYPNLRFLGDTTINGKTYHMYAGVSPDPFTGTNIANIALMSADETAFTMNPILTKDGYYYYAYSNVTIGTPDSSTWYSLPAACNATASSTNNVTCTPACGNNAHCVSGTCACLLGYVGDNATIGCTPNISTPVTVGSMNRTYDQFVLNPAGDAKSLRAIGVFVDTRNITVEYYTEWVQDIENRRIRYDVEMADYYLYTITLDSGTYRVRMADGNITCTWNPLSFAQLVNTTMYPSLRYLVDAVYGGKPCRVYIGDGADSMGRMQPMVKYISTTGELLLTATLNDRGYDYYDYKAVTVGTPDPDLFDIPDVCLPSTTTRTTTTTTTTTASPILRNTTTVAWNATTSAGHRDITVPSATTLVLLFLSKIMF